MVTPTIDFTESHVYSFLCCDL